MSQKKNTVPDKGTSGGSGVLEIERSVEILPPPLYQVWLLNDDFTPMEFVIEILREFFYKKEDEAEQIMLKVHHEGRAVCGQYPRDVAETKAMRVVRYAQTHGHPLLCVVDN